MLCPSIFPRLPGATALQKREAAGLSEGEPSQKEKEVLVEKRERHEVF